MLVPRAFLAARLAHLGAQLAKLLREDTAACHVPGCRPADGGAVHVERDASGHHLYVLLLQAGCGAVVAGIGAGVACLNAGSVDLMHVFLLQGLVEAAGVRHTVLRMEVTAVGVSDGRGTGLGGLGFDLSGQGRGPTEEAIDGARCVDEAERDAPLTTTLRPGASYDRSGPRMM